MKSIVLAILFSCVPACLVGCGDGQPSEDGAAQIQKADQKTGDVPQGIDPKGTSDDPSYGYTKNNPIKVGGPKGFRGPESERLYLRHLRDSQFNVFRFRRSGSVGAGPDGHVLDLYELTSSDGNTYKVYIDMYHPDVHPFSVQAPKGMYFWK